MATAPPTSRPPSGPPAKDQGLPTLPRGATIGRYVVLGLVGRGGMGEVYAAYDPELDRKVAVKLLRVKPGNGVSRNEGRQRTLREAQAIARLSHPNVVVVFDVGTFQEQVFIAMEFVEGNTVSYWLQAADRSWQDIVKVFMAAGRGLAAAHEKGLVHRDFKPDNVMVGRDNQVRVMDFGLARQVNEKPAPGERSNHGEKSGGVSERSGHGVSERSGHGEPVTPTQAVPVPVIEHGPGADISVDVPETIVLAGPPGTTTSVEAQAHAAVAGMFDMQLTRTGAMMGTPAYMAPEQFLGTATDARTDQFSFCIALYEALYGERPFAGNTMYALTNNVVQGKVRDAPLHSNVPLWIRKILLRGLRSAAGDRFPSMGELLDALGKNPATKRRKVAVFIASALLPAVLAVGIRQSVVDNRAVCGGGHARLAGVWELRRPGEPEPARHARVKNAFLHTGKSYASDVHATVNRVLTGYAQAWANMYEEACAATQIHREQSTEVLDLRMSCLQERLGGLRALTDVFSEANGDVVENAVSAANALGSLDRCADVPLLRSLVRPPEDPATRAKVADLRHRLAALKARSDAGRWKESLKAMQAVEAEARAIGYQPLVAEILQLEGAVLGRSNDWKAAEKKLIESFWAADASFHDEVRAAAAIELVFVFGYQEGLFDEAERWSGTAEAVLQRMGGHELLHAWQLNNIGAVRGLKGEREAALRAQQQAILLKQRALGHDHPDVGVSEGNIAVELAGLARNQEALVHVDSSVALIENGYGASHPVLAAQYNNRGEILAALGRQREARQSFERARVIWERELGLEDRNLAYALTGIGLTYLAENDPGSALAPLERAFKIREAHEVDPSRRAETRFALARSLWEANRDRARARALAEQAREGYAKGDVRAKVVEVDGWLRGRGSS
jgi:eukaryotic-like serine/threonine-protein kinase